MIGRREFITLLGGAAVALPRAAWASARVSVPDRAGRSQGGPYQ
jgi:hypothetical protein